MPARKKIALEVIPRLQEDLRRRNHLIAELARYDYKLLAARYGVHRTTIWRFEDAMYGVHRHDVHVRPRISAAVPRETQTDVRLEPGLVDTIG